MGGEWLLERLGLQLVGMGMMGVQLRHHVVLWCCVLWLNGGRHVVLCWLGGEREHGAVLWWCFVLRLCGVWRLWSAGGKG